MRICIVMGAGASYANGIEFRRSRRLATVPPLDYTFFPKIEELGVSVPRDLRQYAQALPTGDPFSLGGRMEEFLRDLFHDFTNEAGTAKSRPVRAYMQLVDIYASVIEQTTDWMRGSSYAGGPVGKVIAAAAEVADRVDVITFNHDLVIENEIYRRARLRGRWCIERAYDSFSDNRTLLQHGSEPLFDLHDDNTCDHSRPIVIHKMHGSLNWYIRIRGSEPTPGVLAGRVSSPPDVMISAVRSLQTRMRSVRMSPTGPGRKSWRVWPVIVPPIYAKNALIQAFMPSVWADARTALAECDRVVFFGYSLPQPDIEAEKLFQRTITANDRLPWVGIIDPATAAVTRYAQLMPNMPLRRYPDAGLFLESDMFDPVV
jgi:hypothetical protein